MILVEIGIGLGTSFVGSFLAVLVVIHWDIEGFWQQRRLEHGKRLDQRAEEAAKKHGAKGSR
jgi:hypothetical protein